MSNKRKTTRQFKVNPDGTITKKNPLDDFSEVAQAVAGTGGPKHFKLNLRHKKHRRYVIVLALDNTYYHDAYNAYCILSKNKGPIPMTCSKDELYLDSAFHFTKSQVKRIEDREKSHGLNGKDTVIEVDKIKNSLK